MDEVLCSVWNRYMLSGGSDEFISGGCRLSTWGIPTLAPILTIKCSHCGNMYPKEIWMKFPNCPTCAGGWSD